MDINSEINNAKTNPEQLERLYRESRAAGDEQSYQVALLDLHALEPDNPLLQAWFYRLQANMAAPTRARRSVNWFAAIPISILTGLFFWALSDYSRFIIFDDVPTLIFWWSPIAAVGALLFLAFSSGRHHMRAVGLALGLLAISAYVSLIVPTLSESWLQEHYLVLAGIHLPLLSWSALGLHILGLRSSQEDRFAFLIKSVEVVITAGVYLITGMVFGGITVGMFAALSINLPELVLRLIAAGGFGLLPVLALASVYDPSRSPTEQDFNQGLSRFIATMMRLLLPLTLAVLSIYVLVIPFNFLEPFENRDVLIVYNLMLFGIMGLLMGATPIRSQDLAQPLQKWLRSGLLAIIVLAGLVSLYALSATVFRTVEGGITINRMTIIGWNAINITILAGLLFSQRGIAQPGWISAMQSVFSNATNAYIMWGLFLILLVPLLF